MVKARAPTILLRMLLDVLNAIDETAAAGDGSSDDAVHGVAAAAALVSDGNADATAASSRVTATAIGNNPVADALQGLLEVLASDISAEADKVVAKNRPAEEKDMFHEIASASNDVDSEDEDESTMPLLLSSLRTTSLSSPLRKVIAKLLTFLTYGQVGQSGELGRTLSGTSFSTPTMQQGRDRPRTRRRRPKTMPSSWKLCGSGHVAVCDTLRSELIRQEVVLRDVPSCPPPWSPASFFKRYVEDDGRKAAGKRRWTRRWNESGTRPSGERTSNVLAFPWCCAY